MGDFSSVLSSFTIGKSRSECRDTKGSVGERKTRSKLWDLLGVELGNPVRGTLGPDSFSSWLELGRSCAHFLEPLPSLESTGGEERNG